ncbi:uncharacterized protein C5L36_0B11040 [Pichia kudriavzevii]|uniref:C2H2-type domain-containing protein n=1 Tax=Pichia kudriavzevii TaxID=4909 RepID=A0A2U9R431_PICKU|nr:uncharacterized protein C5L36_0B11040 [Pichia kudriavzevii]AWU75868.1 hypothetical protein C5L36_0B11040 [Pichia kudriavzevii]
MYTELEHKRQLIEDLELIEHAVIKRIRHNPQIYKPRDTRLNHDVLIENPKIDESITLLQQHEVQKLLDKYEAERKVLLELLNDEDSILHDLKVLKDPQFENGIFTRFVEECLSIEPSTTEIKDHEIYDMFSSNSAYPEIKKKIKSLENMEIPEDDKQFKRLVKQHQKKTKTDKFNILCSYASDLKLSKIVTSSERNGKRLDLKSSYSEFLTLPRFKPLNEIPKYKHYLKSLGLRDINVRIETPEYFNYLKRLSDYLNGYIQRAYPLVLPLTDNSRQTQLERNTCLACNKKFKLQTTYDAHLKGKKHKKNMEKFKPVLELENEINRLLSILQKQLDETINEVERIELLTVRERELEKNNKQIQSDIISLHSIYGDPSLNIDISDDENDDDDLVTGIEVDGQRIPFWLYKLKGLGHEFKCEICLGVYHGRASYLRHFQEQSHTDSLKDLGVVYGFEQFKGIETKEGVLKLWDTIKRKKMEETAFLEEVEEVEDEEGNAMSTKVYELLKKQGLL